MGHPGLPAHRPFDEMRRGALQLNTASEGHWCSTHQTQQVCRQRCLLRPACAHDLMQGGHGGRVGPGAQRAGAGRSSFPRAPVPCVRARAAAQAAGAARHGPAPAVRAAQPAAREMTDSAEQMKALVCEVVVSGPGRSKAVYCCRLLNARGAPLGPPVPCAPIPGCASILCGLPLLPCCMQIRGAWAPPE